MARSDLVVWIREWFKEGEKTPSELPVTDKELDRLFGLVTGDLKILRARPGYEVSFHGLIEALEMFGNIFSPVGLYYPVVTFRLGMLVERFGEIVLPSSRLFEPPFPGATFRETVDAMIEVLEERFKASKP